MSSAKTIQNQAIDDLIAISYLLEWIPYPQISEVKSSQIDNVYYVIRKQAYDDGRVNEVKIMLLLVGSDEISTP